MSKNTIVFEGGIDNIRTLADNSLRVSLGTPELTAEIVGNMYSMLKQPGYVVISTKPISQQQIDAVEEATVDREFDTKLHHKDCDLYCISYGNKHNQKKWGLMEIQFM
jgi:hypothetical protein